MEAADRSARPETRTRKRRAPIPEEAPAPASCPAPPCAACEPPFRARATRKPPALEDQPPERRSSSWQALRHRPSVAAPTSLANFPSRRPWPVQGKPSSRWRRAARLVPDGSAGSRRGPASEDAHRAGPHRTGSLRPRIPGKARQTHRVVPAALRGSARRAVALRPIAAPDREAAECGPEDAGRNAPRPGKPPSGRPSGTTRSGYTDRSPTGPDRA